MRAGKFKAFYGGIAFLAVCAAGFLSGCASGHKQFVYVAGPGTNETFEFRVQSNGSLAAFGDAEFSCRVKSGGAEAAYFRRLPLYSGLFRQ